MAGKVICQLAHENGEAQQYLCSHSGFNQVSGKVCINPIPASLQQAIAADPSILKQIQETRARTKGVQYWSYPACTTTEDPNFPDPLTHLVGFYTPAHEKRRANMSLVPRFFVYVPSRILEHVLKSRAGNFRASPNGKKAEFKSQEWSRPVTTSEVRKGRAHVESPAEDEQPGNSQATDEETSEKFRPSLLEEDKEASTGVGVKRISRKLKKTMNEVTHNFKLSNKNKPDDTPRKQKKIETNIKKAKDRTGDSGSKK